MTSLTWIIPAGEFDELTYDQTKSQFIKSGRDVVSYPAAQGTLDELIVNAYQYGLGLFAFISPTGLILASLTMVKVGYDKWLRFVMPLLGILLMITMIILTISVYT